MFVPTLGRAKGVLLCLLALILLLAPVCRNACGAYRCEAANAAPSSPCHESAGPAPDAGGSVRAERGCGIQELPAVLPEDIRTLRSASLESAKAAVAPVVSDSFGEIRAGYSPDLSGSREGRGRPRNTLSPAVPLRI